MYGLKHGSGLALTIRQEKNAVIFGTRPEAIKMAPVVLRLYEEKQTFQVKTLVTAQHRQMLDQGQSYSD